jgi:hypothetical protein
MHSCIVNLKGVKGRKRNFASYKTFDFEIKWDPCKLQNFEIIIGPLIIIADLENH